MFLFLLLKSGFEMYVSRNFREFIENVIGKDIVIIIMIIDKFYVTVIL